jgi:molybdate transport system regulatory protein
MPALSLRIDFSPRERIGPGKIRLLEHIGTSGSISAAARAMDMSYKHAWDLIEEMNRLFGKPLVHTQTGGREGGGARLTAVGRTVVARFRAIERTAAKAVRSELEALEAEISPT